ncbi:MAG: hypothetical protein QNI84_17410 [Henriciella sp.]|nr:hypothetical protein [Henriciella sp.]
MSEENFKAVAASTKRFFQDENPETLAMIDDLAAVLQKHHDAGEPNPFITAYTLLKLSMDTMWTYGSMDAIESYACFVREFGEETRTVIAEHWPPPDPEGFQWDHKKKT